MQSQFDKLQARWLMAIRNADSLSSALSYQYAGQYRTYAPKSKLAKLDAACRAEERAQDAFYHWLDIHSPRNWRSGVPYSWPAYNLTYNDAITHGALSIVPPCCFGAHPSDMTRFAAALKE